MRAQPAVALRSRRAAALRPSQAGACRQRSSALPPQPLQRASSSQGSSPSSGSPPADGRSLLLPPPPRPRRPCRLLLVWAWNVGSLLMARIYDGFSFGEVFGWVARGWVGSIYWVVCFWVRVSACLCAYVWMD